MRTLAAVGMALSLVVVLGLSANAGAAAPAPKASPVAAGSLFDVGSDTGAVSKLTVSGEMRTRWEDRQNMTDFSSAAHDRQEWVDARARLGLKFELTEETEVFIQAQSRYLWGGQSGLNDAVGGTPAAGIDDHDSLDLYQAYVKFQPEIFGVETTLTIGRMELPLGSEMLLGNATTGAGLSHDAVRLDMSLIENLSTSLIVAKLVENSAWFQENSNALTTNPAARNDTHFYALWNTYDINDDMLVDFYVLYLSEDDEADQASTFTLFDADAKIWTFGARYKVKEFMVYGQKFDASAELAVQLGSVNIAGAGDDLDIQDSFATELELGWMPDLPWSPRLAFGMAWASGDDEATDGNFNHFMPLFQETVGRLGNADVVTLQNLRCWYFDLACNPMDKEEWKVGTTYLRFEAFEELDGMGAGGIGNAGNVTANNIGDEIDLYTAYKVNENTDLSLCFSWLEPQDYVTEQAANGNSPAYRVSLSMVVKF